MTDAVETLQVVSDLEPAGLEVRGEYATTWYFSQCCYDYKASRHVHGAYCVVCLLTVAALEALAGLCLRLQQVT